MVIFDEQLLGLGLEVSVAQWYPGASRFITDLRPRTIIKDEAIPALLATEANPTFVTINVSDFWQKIDADSRFCVVCVAVPDSRAGEVSLLLRRLMRMPEFRTKAGRMGSVIRIAGNTVTYYRLGDQALRTQMLPSM